VGHRPRVRHPRGCAETGTDTFPDDWTTSSWLQLPDPFGREAMQFRDGAFAAPISNSSANDASFQQSAANRKAGTGYLPGVPAAPRGWLRRWSPKRRRDIRWT
jgi:hypothetical protein